MSSSLILRKKCVNCGVVLTDDEQFMENGLCTDCEAFEATDIDLEDFGVYEVYNESE